MDKFIKNGNFIISGKPFILPLQNTNKIKLPINYKLSPLQARRLFEENNWHNIIGFHTRNILHNAHKFIQLKALKNTNADAIFLSPVSGKKKIGDFTIETIIKTYEIAINNDIYKPFGTLIGAFNTFPRYAGPREAIFTALCRKNYGCKFKTNS